jgi:hypothetical protein
MVNQYTTYDLHIDLKNILDKADAGEVIHLRRRGSRYILRADAPLPKTVPKIIMSPNIVIDGKTIGDL